MKKKNTHELRIELAKAIMSQGYGSKFSKSLESKIARLKKRINANASDWLPSTHG